MTALQCLNEQRALLLEKTALQGAAVATQPSAERDHLLQPGSNKASGSCFVAFLLFFPPISRAAVRLIPVISVQLKLSLLFYLLFNTARFVAIQVSAVSKLCFLRCFSLLLAVLSCFSYQEQNFKQEQISPNF